MGVEVESVGFWGDAADVLELGAFAFGQIRDAASGVLPDSGDVEN